MSTRVQETPAQDEPIRVTVRGEKDLTARPGIGRGKTSELGRGKTAEMERGKSSELGRGKTAEMERGKTSELGRSKTAEMERSKTAELGRGKTSQMERGKSSGEVARSKFGEGVASSKSKDRAACLATDMNRIEYLAAPCLFPILLRLRTKSVVYSLLFF